MAINIPQSELDALARDFQLMWGNFPEPAQLTHKSREIIALNAASESVGLVKGGKCSECGAPEMHKGCLANRALNTQQPLFQKTKFGDRDRISYWLPVNGYPELFVHFGVGTIIDYNEAAEQIPGK
ncbi:hypothetical protein M7775_04100 [Sporomusa sphaeroides DSM 2875]|uniref:hypothetical protein n=1 Tax=Sporomusa sphaeroides TaxID=47679 RepID=UPI00202E6DD1|nr:hypothetical protein [Sporomusa sphaeroides]MCM0757753.1 hypothetical protein [Sporomusa sphaeroides DSM 2875]